MRGFVLVSHYLPAERVSLRQFKFTMRDEVLMRLGLQDLNWAPDPAAVLPNRQRLLALAARLQASVSAGVEERLQTHERQSSAAVAS